MVKVINYRYPFDPYGANPECLISKERHSLSAVSSASFALIVPKNGPFFRRGLVVKHISTDKKLTEGVDFALGHKFTRATVETARPVYGSILILNRELTGAFDVDYQTLGGEFVIDTQAALDALLNTQLDPRNTTWEAVIDVPPLFPPYEHYFDADNLVGADALRLAILQVSDTIKTMPEKLMPMLMLHLDDTGNPHRVDKTAVGLGNVDNFRTASVAETVEGMLNNRFVTPAGVRQLIASINSETVASHAARFDNPHHVSKDQVGLSNVPNFPVATVEQAKLGEIDNAFMTPQLTKMAISGQVGNSLTTHLGNKANPHGTTKGHVGLGLVENYQMATVEEAKAGLAKDRYVSPFLVAQYVQQTTGGAAAAHISDLNNPHQTNKNQIGLGQVQNYPLASASEAQLGNDNDKYMTPLLTAKAINYQVGTTLAEHLTNTSNPHGVNKEDVGLGQVPNYAMALVDDVNNSAANKFLSPKLMKDWAIGYVQPVFNHAAAQGNPHNTNKNHVGLGNVLNYPVATIDEALAGVSNEAYMTPALVREVVSTISGDKVVTHIANENNPHKVNKGQVGLGNVLNYGVATIEQALAGTATDVYVTPALVKAMINAITGGSINEHLLNYNNPHQVNKDQVGLGNLHNYSTAVQADYEGSGAPDKYATPAGVVQAITNAKNTIDQSIIQHTGNNNNPHNTNKNHVGLGNVDNLKTAVPIDYDAGNNSAFATPGHTVDWVKAYIATLNLGANNIIPVAVNSNTELKVGKHYRVMGLAQLIFPAEEGEIRIIVDHTVDVTTGGVSTIAPPTEVFHTSSGDDTVVTLRDVGVEYIYQRINGAWRLS